MSSTNPKQVKAVDRTSVEPKKVRDQGREHERPADLAELLRKVQNTDPHSQRVPDTPHEIMSELYIG